MTHQTIRVPSQVPLSDRQPEVQQTRVQAHGRWFNSLPALAGIGYGIAWVVGLAAWPSNLAIDASEKEIVTVYATHMSQAATQYLLVEGLAGVLLGMVLLYCLRHASHCDPTWTARAAVAAGCAVAISLVQCFLGLLLASSASSGHLARSGDIYQLINRLDGVKQLLLSVCVVILGVLFQTASNYPLRLKRIAVVVGIALVPSGLANVLLWNALAGATFVSLPLLILWVGGTGIWLGAKSQRELGSRSPSGSAPNTRSLTVGPRTQ